MGINYVKMLPKEIEVSKEFREMYPRLPLYVSRLTGQLILVGNIFRGKRPPVMT